MSFIRILIQQAIKIIKYHPERLLVGQDELGNKYYEIPPQTYFMGMSQITGTKRTVEPPNYKDLQNSLQTLHAGESIPMEWESWLRKKRNDPPTNEEITSNKINAQRIQHRVEKIEEKLDKTRLKQSLSKHAAINYKPSEEIQEVESWSPEKEKM